MTSRVWSSSSSRVILLLLSVSSAFSADFELNPQQVGLCFSPARPRVGPNLMRAVLELGCSWPSKSTCRLLRPCINPRHCTRACRRMGRAHPCNQHSQNISAIWSWCGPGYSHVPQSPGVLRICPMTACVASSFCNNNNIFHKIFEMVYVRGCPSTNACPEPDASCIPFRHKLQV